MKEIELRFQVPPAQWEAVHRWVSGDDEPAGVGAHQERLRASYFDTPERHLARAGYALRLRLEGQSWVQTLKGAAPDGMTRLEHNVPVSAPADGTVPALDLGRHADHPAGQGLQALLVRLGSPALQALFRTDIERLSRALSTPFGEVELALDHGALLAGDGVEERRTPVAELEIELKQGDPRAVLEVAREWALGRFGLTLELRTKALRGDLLARREAVASAQASAAAVWRPGQTQAQALAVLLKSVVEPVLGNASQIVSGLHQPEHLHQLRVALRRLRVGVDLLAGAAVVSPDETLPAAAVLSSEDAGQQAAGMAVMQNATMTPTAPTAPTASTAPFTPATPNAPTTPDAIATPSVTAADLVALRSLGEGAKQLGQLLAEARDADAQTLAAWRQDLERAWQQAAVAVAGRPADLPLRKRPLEGPSPTELLAEPLWQGWMLSIVAWLVRGWPGTGPIEAVVPEVEQLGDKALHLARRFDKLDVEGRHHLRRRLRRWKMALEMTGTLKAAKSGRSGKADNADQANQADKADRADRSGKAPAPHTSDAASKSLRSIPRKVVKLMTLVQDVQKPLGELNDLETGLVHARAALVRAVAAGQADEAARAGFDLAWLLPVRNDALSRMRRRVKRLKR